MQCERVRIVAVFEVRVRQEIRGDALVQRVPGLPAIHALEHAAYRYADIEVARIGRVDTDRMHLRAVGSRKDGGLYLRIQDVVEPGDFRPCDTAVGRTEQARRRRPRIPDAGFGRMRGRKPEHAFHRAPVLAFRGFFEHGWLLRLGPGLAAIVRTEHGRAEMAGFRGHQQRARVARIRDEVIDDVAKKMRAVELPRFSCSVAAVNECALARADQQRDRGSHACYLLPESDPRLPIIPGSERYPRRQVLNRTLRSQSGTGLAQSSRSSPPEK